MKIKWYAHACLRIEGAGVSIITDPYTPYKSGFATIIEPADIVVRSSDDDSAHANADMIPGTPEVVTATHILDSGQTVRGIHFSAVPAQESMRVKLQPRDNAMYCFTLEGIRIVHFGDVGNRLANWQLTAIANTPVERAAGSMPSSYSPLPLEAGVDVAIVPTGGPPTIELDDLYDALDTLGPAIIIPMHHELPGCKFPRMADVTEFTQHYPSTHIYWADTEEVEISRANLPTETQVWVLQAVAAG